MKTKGSVLLLILLAAFLQLQSGSAAAGSWPATNPQSCTPDGWGSPAYCAPARIGDWEVFDFSGVPYVGTFPGMHPSIGIYLGAVKSHYESSGQHCQVSLSSATGPRDQAFQYGIVVAETYDYEITMGNTEVPCNPQLIAWPDLRRVRPVTCQSPYQATTMGGSLICACPQNAACAFGPPPPCCDPAMGNPVLIVNANKREVQVDYQSSSGLKFARTYNSLFRFYEDGSNQVGRRLGTNWTATYLQRLQYSDAGATAGAWVFRPDGSTRAFYETSTSFSQGPDTVERLSWVLDGGGNKIGFKLVTDDDSVEIYSMNGNLLSITSRSGVVQTLAYDAADNPISVTDSFGNVLQFQWSSGAPPKRLVGLIAPGSLQFTYGYDGNGNLSSVTCPDALQRIYHYEYGDVPRSTMLTGITDEAAVRYATWEYNTWLLPISSEHAGGVERYVFDWSSPNYFERKVIDPLGTTRTYSVANVANRRRYTSSSSPCPGCQESASAGYDANGNTSAKTDFSGNQTTYGFDLTRNLQTTRTDAFGTAKARTITTAWHANYRRPTSITEPNRITTFTHDANGNVLTRTVTDTSVTPNVSRTWTYTYNVFGRVLTENGPRTDVTDLTTFTYYTCTGGSQCGHLNTITNAAGHVTTYNSYNAHGQPTQITDANGLVTTLAYDARQRMTDRCVGGTLPSCTGGELTHLDYWPTGLLEKVTSPEGSFIQYTYDGAHRLTQIQDGDGNKIVYTLDNASNRTAENVYDPSNALRRTHSRVFNSLNQLWKDVNAAGTAAVTTTFGYDSDGKQTTTAAPLSRNSANAYDELNRLNQITDPNSGVTQFGYDANDNLTSVTDPRSLVTSYTYTGFGDLKTQVSPDTGTTTNTYDSGGNLKTGTDARNAITTYTYDTLNRVISVAFKIGSTTDQTITYTYDGGTNQKGHLTAASDANHSMSWSYDAQGRVTGKGQTVGTVTKSVGYAYNAQGQLASIVLPSGKTIQYGYNPNGQVTSLTLAGAPNVTILNNITYDPFGPIAGWSWGNGTASTSRTFDADGKLTGIANLPTAIGNRTLGYDDAFRITAASDVATPANSWTLGYDLLDRLSSATKTGTTIGYTYDANGNRLSQTGTSASTYTVAGASNKLSSTTGALARTYTYDALGSVLTSGATTHTYYNSGRMKTAKLGAASATTYVYNALGQRVKKSGGAATTTLYLYEEAGHLLGEYSSTGVLVQETVWLGDIPVATLRPNGANVDVFYVHTDQLNTPRKVSRPSDNQLRWRWDPTPFGEGTPNENPAALGAFKYNLRFPGQYFDLETNLNYNYFRDYDPAIGRYVESDPIGLRGGLNSYSYVDQQPNRFSDSSGLELVGNGLGTWPGQPPASSAPPIPIDVPTWARVGGRIVGRVIPGLNYILLAADLYSMCTEDEDIDKNCEELYQSTLRTCASLTGRKKFRCFEAARENREQCYQQRNKDRGPKP